MTAQRPENPDSLVKVSGYIDASAQWAAEVLGTSPEPRCPNSYDIHCSHWYKGLTCCRCGQMRSTPENTASPGYPSVTDETAQP